MPDQSVLSDQHSSDIHPADPDLRIKERWLTQRDAAQDVDSVAVWHGQGGQHWLLATAKGSHQIHVFDARSGGALDRVGGPGQSAGQFQRPNGISVIDDLVWVVERDNHRVQVLRLPSLTPIGMFGEQDLINPYGLWVHKLDQNADGQAHYQVFVTDNYETADQQVPPDGELDRRVRQWRVTVADTSLTAEAGEPFGATEGRGVLRVVESIFGDVAYDRLLLVEEDEDSLPGGRVYDLGGQFSGQLTGIGLFDGQPEGVALYACPDGSGYWVMADQGEQINRFHVFERDNFTHVGTFSGEHTLNTDGVWLTRKSFPGFPTGAFYAVHDDGNVAAFSWADVIDVLGLQPTCPPPAAQLDALHQLVPAGALQGNGQ